MATETTESKMSVACYEMKLMLFADDVNVLKCVC